MGDGFLVEFASPMQAMTCAISPASFDFQVRERPPWFRPQEHAHMLDGLRKAGWEG